MMRRIILPSLLFSLSVFALQGCPSPAAPPAPPAEIPSFLTLPNDLSINVDELSSSSALKLQSLEPKDIGFAIEVSSAAIEEANQFLDIGLTPTSATDIPVSASLFNFKNTFSITRTVDTVEITENIDLKFDFGRFDLDGDGNLESCSGCTCPAGCAPDLAVCPSEAPEADLKPICVRVWLDGVRFMAGLFDKVPTRDNPRSGQVRFELPSFADLAKSPFGIVYDHGDPNDRRTDLSAFLKDSGVGSGDSFFANRRSLGQIIGPEDTAKKLSKLTTTFISPPSANPGLLQFQSTYFTDLDFIALELLAEGLFSDDETIGFFGLPDITPPICAQISTNNPVADILCTDLGLTLSPGAFLPEPLLEDVLLPPFSEFPESPTF